MRRCAAFLLASFLALAFLACAAALAGLRINTTPSYPIGIYILTHEPIRKGSLVIFCPADTPAFRQALGRGYIDAGFCPGGFGYMIKKIMAAGGDRVDISAAGVAVNDQLLPRSQPMAADSSGQPLPHMEIHTVLDKHTVLLMSDYNPKSFDARYFGLVDGKQVIGTVRPVWVFSFIISAPVFNDLERGDLWITGHLV